MACGTVWVVGDARSPQAQRQAAIMTDASHDKRDFLISFNQADRAWATWIAWVLEDAGHSAFFQDWDFKGHFVLAMDYAHTHSRRTLLVLSPDYLTSDFTAPEWATRFAEDARSEHDLLIPIRVRSCKPEGLLAPIVYVDLVSCGELEARKKILDRFGCGDSEASRKILDQEAGIRLKPDKPPLFPGPPSLPPAGKARGIKPILPDPMVGRESDIKTIISILLGEQFGPVAVMGGPGMGRTTVCVAVLDDLKIAETFPRRYFISLLDAKTKADALQAIADALEVPVKRTLLEDVQDDLKQARTLLILDDAHVPWNSSRVEMVQLFRELCRIEGSTFIASFAGYECVYNIRWSGQIELKQLLPEHSKLLFEAITSNRFANDEYFENIIRETSGIPMVITLMAILANRHPNLKLLYDAWRCEHTRMFPDAQPDERLDFRASVKLAVNDPRMTEEGRRLLSLLGLLPLGIATSDLPAVLPGFGYRARDVLRVTGLAIDAEDERVYLRKPVYEYVREKHQPAQDDQDRLLDHFLSLAESGHKVGSIGGGAIADRLRRESVNIEALIRKSFNPTNPLPAIKAAIGFARYQRFVAAGTTKLLERASEKAAELTDKRPQAECLRVIATIQLERSLFREARSNVEKAEALYRANRETLGLAHCSRIFADISQDQHNFPDATRNYRKALRQYGSVERNTVSESGAGYYGVPTRRGETIKGKAHCTERLGALEQAKHSDDGYRKAKVFYNEAIKLYNQVGDVLGKASCIKGLGDIAMLSDTYQAKHLYEEAEQLCKIVPFLRGQSNCIYSIADIEFRDGNYSRARFLYEQAMDLYEKVDRVHGRANCLYSLGDVALVESHLAESYKADLLDQAETHYSAALQLYERFADSVDPIGEANCFLGLSDIARARNDTAADELQQRAQALARKAIKNLGTTPSFSIDSHGPLSGRWRR